jgi:hypothetical protein
MSVRRRWVLLAIVIGLLAFLYIARPLTTGGMMG